MKTKWKERAEKAEAANDELEREVTILRKSFFEEKEARIADNAALTARIKELEADVKREAQSSTNNAQDCLDEQLRAEALEAKLVAAEKALEFYANPAINARFETSENGITGIRFVDVKRVEYEDDGSLTVVIDYWPEPARAALEKKD